MNEFDLFLMELDSSDFSVTEKISMAVEKMREIAAERTFSEWGH